MDRRNFIRSVLAAPLAIQAIREVPAIAETALPGGCDLQPVEVIEAWRKGVQLWESGEDFFAAFEPFIQAVEREEAAEQIRLGGPER